MYWTLSYQIPSKTAKKLKHISFAEHSVTEIDLKCFLTYVEKKLELFHSTNSDTLSYFLNVPVNEKYKVKFLMHHLPVDVFWAP